MGREQLPPPVTAGDFYAAALLDALNTVRDLLDDRLPALTAGGGPVVPAEDEAIPEPEPIAIQEPAPNRRPHKPGRGR